MTLPAGRWSRFDVWLLAAAVAVRLLLLAYAAPDRGKLFTTDSDVYEAFALELLDTGRYRVAEVEPHSDLFRPPGYPAFIAANYALFGRGRYVVLVLWNVVGFVMLYAGLRALFGVLGTAPRRLVCALLAFDLAWMLYGLQVLTEPLFTPMLVWSLVLVLRARRDGNPAGFAGAGGLMGAATLLKPVLLYPAAAVVLFAARRTLRGGLLLAFAFVACAAPWMVRNAAVHGVPVFSSLPGIHLLMGHAAYVHAAEEGLTHEAAKKELEVRLERRLAGPAAEASYAELDRARRQEARRVLVEHPLVEARGLAVGTVLTFLDPGRYVFNRMFPTEDTERIGLLNELARGGIPAVVRAMLRKHPLPLTVLTLYAAVLGVAALLALVGVVPFWRRDRGAALLLGGLVVFFAVSGGPLGNARFRMYLYPLLLVFVHHGAEWVAVRWRARRANGRAHAALS